MTAPCYDGSMRRVGPSACLLACLVACGGDDPAQPDASPPPLDGAPDASDLDGALPDAGDVDGASPDATPAGFGAVTGQCGVLTPTELDGTTPLWFQGDFTFSERYDDPLDRPQLTPGGQYIVAMPNAGGSSVFSEVFAFEWLARCEAATLIKTETEIVYDVVGKKADLLVAIDERKVGVSVTRAMTFPFGQPYTLAAATALLDRKLDDLQLATAQVSAADRWSKQMLAILAYDTQHAAMAMTAWNQLDAATRDDTILVVAVTNGDDLFIYTDQ